MSLDISHMLRALADDGWKPVLHQEGRLVGYQVWAPSGGWVCYPDTDVRYFFMGRGDDPGTAVLALWSHAQQHPNRRPARPAPEDTAAVPLAPAAQSTAAGGPPETAEERRERVAEDCMAGAPAAVPMPTNGVARVLALVLAVVAGVLTGWRRLA